MTDQTEKSIRLRSPNYPAFSLEQCIEKARVLFETFKRSGVAFEVASNALKHSPKSSVGKQVMAALSYYGLIEIEGRGNDRRVKVSDLAFNIIIDDRPDSSGRDTAIREAAMNPSIFKKIMDSYEGKHPADSALEYDLKTKYKFNPKTAKGFVKVFNNTMDFAKMYKNDIMPDENALHEETGMITQEDKIGAKGTAPRETIKPLVTAGTGNEREIANYPVGRGLKAKITFYGDSAITIQSIEKLIQLLQLNKEDLPEEKPDGKEPN